MAFIKQAYLGLSDKNKLKTKKNRSRLSFNKTYLNFKFKPRSAFNMLFLRVKGRLLIKPKRFEASSFSYVLGLLYEPVLRFHFKIFQG